MKLLERILVASDFRKSSDNLIENGIILAKTFKSKVTLMHVLPDDIKNEKAKSLLNEAATNQMRLIINHVNSQGLKTDNPIVKHGSYSNKIVEVADSINANLILIGSGEKTTKEACRLGSTAERIIRMSNKPVWVVKKDNPLKVRTIFCPVDFSDQSKRALKNAVTIARRFEAKLIIFSVYDLLDRPISVRINCDEINLARKSDHIRDLDTFLEDFNFTDLNWSEKVVGGFPAVEILKELKKHSPDLLIMGTTGKTGLSKLLMGSIAEKVIREVPCSFITLKSEDIIDLKIETRILDIQNHYKVANQLVKDGFFKEAITEFEICLNINEMHIPSLKGVAVAYEKLDDTLKAEKYENLANKILERI